MSAELKQDVLFAKQGFEQMNGKEFSLNEVLCLIIRDSLTGTAWEEAVEEGITISNQSR